VLLGTPRTFDLGTVPWLHFLSEIGLLEGAINAVFDFWLLEKRGILDGYLVI